MPNTTQTKMQTQLDEVLHCATRDRRRDRRHHRRALFVVVPRVVSGGLLCLAGLGCSSDATGPDPQDITTAYWTLQLNHHAVTMALPTPYNSVQLTAAPLTVAGTPVPGAGRVQYSATDSTVAVDSSGRMTARYATLNQAARVVASLTVQGITLADTAFVQVDSFPRAPLTTFSIHPLGSRCRRSVYDASFTLPVYAIDAVGDTLRNARVANVPVYYTSSDQAIATIDRSYGNVTGRVPGTVTFTATALIDGVTRQDTLAYVLDPRHDLVNITAIVHHGVGGAAPTLTLMPSTVTVGAGWSVAFDNPTLDTVDIVFADSARGTNGTLVGHYPDSDLAHTGPIVPGNLGELFFDAGTYNYRSERFGQSGTIRVQCGYVQDITRTK